jgi:hypothetical protein
MQHPPKFTQIDIFGFENIPSGNPDQRAVIFFHENQLPTVDYCWKFAIMYVCTYVLLKLWTGKREWFCFNSSEKIGKKNFTRLRMVFFSQRPSTHVINRRPLSEFRETGFFPWDRIFR